MQQQANKRAVKTRQNLKSTLLLLLRTECWHRISIPLFNSLKGKGRWYVNDRIKWLVWTEVPVRKGPECYDWAKWTPFIFPSTSVTLEPSRSRGLTLLEDRNKSETDTFWHDSCAVPPLFLENLSVQPHLSESVLEFEILQHGKLFEN